MTEEEFNKLVDTVKITKNISDSFYMGLGILSAKNYQLYADHDVVGVTGLEKSLKELPTYVVSSLIALGWYGDFEEDSWCHYV